MMSFSVADAIAAAGGDQTSDISAILPQGIAPGAKLIMRREKAAAEEAIKTGKYVTWRSLKTGEDCARVGLRSRCFCGCSYAQHQFRRRCILPVCTRCECRAFDFIPSRPEEVGEWWLPRRRGFDALAWRAKCRCGHPHDAHHPSRRSCGSCKCCDFSSAYGCVVCDAHQEDHETRIETAAERSSAGRAIGRDFIPLSQSPQLSRLTFEKSCTPTDEEPATTVRRQSAAHRSCTRTGSLDRRDTTSLSSRLPVNQLPRPRHAPLETIAAPPRDQVPVGAVGAYRGNDMRHFDSADGAPSVRLSKGYPSLKVLREASKAQVLDDCGASSTPEDDLL